MKRTLSFILIAVMLMSVVPFALAYDVETMETISLGDSKTVTANRNNLVSFFKFVPEQSGEYVFYSTSDGRVDTYGYLYSEEGEWIDECDDEIDGHFAVYGELEKGKTYILKTHLYDPSNSATYTVHAGVTGLDATAIVPRDTDIEFYLDSMGYVYYDLVPFAADEENVSFSSDNEAVVTVNGYGELYGHAAGTAKITLSTESGLSATVNVTVAAPAPLALDTPVTGKANDDGYAKFAFTPNESGYYTFTSNSKSYGEIYVTDGMGTVYGTHGQNISVSDYLEKDTTYTVCVNIYSEDNPALTIEAKKSVAATEIEIEGSTERKLITTHMDYIYVNAVNGVITGDVEWSVSDDSVAIVEKVNSTTAAVRLRKTGEFTVTAKFGNSTATVKYTGVNPGVVTTATPYVEETKGYSPAFTTFIPAKDAFYRVSATDELGNDVRITVSGEGENTNNFDIYLEKDQRYNITAERVFEGIAMGFDENDYVGDITITVTELLPATDFSFEGGNDRTTYVDCWHTIPLVTEPDAATIDGIDWVVSDTKNAEISTSNGYAEVIFYKTGEYTVSAAYCGKIETANITVKDVEPLEVGTTYEYKLDAANPMFIATAPTDVSAMYTVTVKSDNPVYAESYRNGGSGKDIKFTMPAIEGEFEPITVRTIGSPDASFTIKLEKAKEPKFVSVTDKNIILSVDESYAPWLAFSPSGLREEVKEYNIADTSVVEDAGDGIIIAVAPGTTTVEVVTEYGLKDTFTVTVVGDDYDWARDVAVDQKEITLEAGASTTLTATVDADSKKTVYWSTDDPSIARIDENGRVTGISAGSTAVYAYVDGIWSQCYVTVTAPVIEDTSAVFTDVKKGWYKDAVDYCYSYGFIAGTAKDTFGRDTKVNRGMFITILARIAGVDTSKAANQVTTKFTDVKSGKYYTAAIKWASDNGIVAGTSDTTFGPENEISRQDLCVMVVNFANFMHIDLEATKDEVTFADAASIRKYAKNAVKTCQMAEIVSGYNEKSGVEFKPTKNATRAEAAQILYKFHSDFIA